ncbi:MAG TPA: pitrilysin family protein [Longimicrobiaceae bacterium]
MRRAVLPRPVPGRPPRPRPPAAERQTLDNGLRVVTVTRATVPQIAIRLVLPAGSAADPQGHEGLASLTGGLLLEGTEALSAYELHRRLDWLGASLTVQVGHDFAEVDLLLLKETLPEGIDLLADILVHAAFPERELSRLRGETVELLEARRDEPANVADDALAEALFGGAHPYGLLPQGTIESVSGLERDLVVDFHRRHYRPQGAVLIAAGDLESADFVRLLDVRLGGWNGGTAHPEYPAAPERPASGESRISIPWEDATQSEIRVGGIGLPRNSSDWVTAALGNYLLGGSTITGRLGANLREDKGWTYGVRSGFSASVQPGAWVIETAVDDDVTDAAIDEIAAELTRFLEEPVPEEELRRGKDALILSLPRAFETPGRIVARLATVEAFGLPEDYWSTFPERVEAVTPEELRRVARTLFDPARLVTVSVGG